MSTPVTPNLPSHDDLVKFVMSKGYSEEEAKDLVSANTAAIIKAMQNEQTEPKLVAPTNADVDAAVGEQNEEAPTPEPHPQATAPATPEPEVQTSAPGDAPESLPSPTSHREGVKGGPTQPSNDTTQFDDLGNEKKDDGIGGKGFGPRGKGQPPDILTDEQRAQIALAQENRLKAGMSSTDKIDSTGKPKGHYRVIPQGYDSHGMKIPDKVDTSHPIEPNPPQVGPRGQGAPQDCFHGARPKPKP